MIAVDGLAGDAEKNASGGSGPGSSYGTGQQVVGFAEQQYDQAHSGEEFSWGGALAATGGGAATGASIGAAFVPYGAAVGAVVGGAVGAVTYWLGADPPSVPKRADPPGPLVPFPDPTDERLLWHNEGAAVLNRWPLYPSSTWTPQGLKVSVKGAFTKSAGHRGTHPQAMGHSRLTVFPAVDWQGKGTVSAWLDLIGVPPEERPAVGKVFWALIETPIPYYNTNSSDPKLELKRELATADAKRPMPMVIWLWSNFSDQPYRTLPSQARLLAIEIPKGRPVFQTVPQVEDPLRGDSGVPVQSDRNPPPIGGQPTSVPSWARNPWLISGGVAAAALGLGLLLTSMTSRR